MPTHDQIQAPAHLNGHHQRTFEAIFRHPVAHNVEWHDIRSLLDALTDVTEGHNGALQVTRNGHTLSSHAPKHKDVTSVEDLLAIRHFLEQSLEATVASSSSPGVHLLVKIDHHEAEIYCAGLQGSVPKQIEPFDPHGFGRHLRSENPETDGKRQPERKSFYEAIAATLRDADAIVIFGSGTGESSAMDQLMADLKHHHHDVAEKVIGSVIVDEKHRTEAQLLAQGREVFGRILSSREDLG